MEPPLSTHSDITVNARAYKRSRWTCRCGMVCTTASLDISQNLNSPRACCHVCAPCSLVVNCAILRWKEGKRVITSADGCAATAVYTKQGCWSISKQGKEAKGGRETLHTHTGLRRRSQTHHARHATRAFVPTKVILFATLTRGTPVSACASLCGANHRGSAPWERSFGRSACVRTTGGIHGGPRTSASALLVQRCWEGV